MAEFQELIKNFDRIRDYMRQFYVYGFKVRGDYDVKSARTYDNEKRRIESWLSEYMVSEYTSKGKQVYINVDSRTIRQNLSMRHGRQRVLPAMISCFIFLSRLSFMRSGRD